MASNDDNKKTREIFLYFMPLMYLFAFGSWFVQLPGLYSDNGIIPVKNKLSFSSNKSFSQHFSEKPTLMWICLSFGFSSFTSLQIICFSGVVISFLCLLFKQFRNFFTFILLWGLYFSFCQVGDTFSHFQWDSLLLEVGFLTAFVSPICTITTSTNPVYTRLAFWLIRWLLFRLMFASGVVKLTSECPTWWGLTALNHHFETQCIPTPFAWWAQQLPTWFLKLSVVATYVIEIVLPFLFFAPSRSLRLFGAYAQVFLMIIISLTGSYNFFNFITILLCLSCIDDKHLTYLKNKCSINEIKIRSVKISLFKRWFCSIFDISVLSCIAYYTAVYFSLQFNKNGHLIHSKIAFTSSEFKTWVSQAVDFAMWVGGLSFAYEVFIVLKRALGTEKALGLTIIKTTIATCVCIFMLTISMVPLNYVTPVSKTWPVIEKWHQTTQRYQIVNSYGLFRRMTGVEGRPEIILEAKMHKDASWKEYHFMYKPGNVTKMPPWLVPHQPRLDWQMWFAALGTYQYNPWLINFAYILLQGKPEVLPLLDKERLPFQKQSPDVIRAKLYHYHLTLLSKSGKWPKAFWRRKFVSDYFPELTKDNADLKNFLQFNNLLVKKSKPEKGRVVDFFQKLHQNIESWSATLLLWGLWLTALTIGWSKDYLMHKILK